MENRIRLFLFFMLFFLVRTVSAQEIPENFIVKKDEFKDVTFITNKYGRGIYPYIVKKKDESYIRLVVKYFGRDWIFFDKIIFLIDGEKFERQAGETLREVDDGVYEKSDMYVEDDSFIRKIISTTGEVRFRLVGKSYYRDYVMNKKQIAVFKETINLFDEVSK